MSPKNPYEILGVSHSASTEEIKVAYRNLVKRYHPDLYPTYLQKVWANKKMQEINGAYAILRDPLRRDQYDKSELTSEPVPPARRARSAERTRPRPSTAQTVASWRWYKWSFYGVWATLLAIFFFLILNRDAMTPLESISVLMYIPVTISIFFVGLMFTGIVVVGLIVGFKVVSWFHKKLSATPNHPWRDLGVRLALLATVVLLFLYSAYRAGVTPPWSIFVVLFAVFPLGYIPLAWIATILSEIVALFLYIYRARKLTQATEILLRD